MSDSCAALDNRLVESLFREHYAWLLRWLRTQRWTVIPPEDIVSEVFLALLVMPNVEAVKQPRAMMTTIARRLIIDARRRDSLQRAYEAELMHLPEALEISDEERLIVLEALQGIEAMLASLSLRARKAFVMSQVHGKPYRVIGEELGVSTSMVRRYVEQGLRAAYELAERQKQDAPGRQA